MSAARRQARPRAAQERLERIRRAEKELQPPADPRKDEAEKVGARVTDPEARVMRQVGATEKHYRAQPRDGRACPFRSQCCPKTAEGGRLLIRTEEDRKVAEFRPKMQRPEYRAIYRQRAPGAEFSHACLKEKKGLRRFLRRGLAPVRTETTWAC